MIFLYILAILDIIMCALLIFTLFDNVEDYFTDSPLESELTTTTPVKPIEACSISRFIMEQQNTAKYRIRAARWQAKWRQVKMENNALRRAHCIRRGRPYKLDSFRDLQIHNQ